MSTFPIHFSIDKKNAFRQIFIIARYSTIVVTHKYIYESVDDKLIDNDEGKFWCSAIKVMMKGGKEGQGRYCDKHIKEGIACKIMFAFHFHSIGFISFSTFFFSLRSFAFSVPFEPSQCWNFQRAFDPNYIIIKRKCCS